MSRYQVCANSRGALIQKLESFAEDRMRTGKYDRAAAARTAASALSTGDTWVEFESVYYVATEDERGYWMVYKWPRARITAWIVDAQGGWEHNARPDLVAQCKTAYADMIRGALSVIVGYTLLIVAEDDPIG